MRSITLVPPAGHASRTATSSCVQLLRNNPPGTTVSVSVPSRRYNHALQVPLSYSTRRLLENDDRSANRRAAQFYTRNAQHGASSNSSSSNALLSHWMRRAFYSTSAAVQPVPIYATGPRRDDGTDAADINRGDTTPAPSQDSPSSSNSARTSTEQEDSADVEVDDGSAPATASSAANAANKSSSASQTASPYQLAILRGDLELATQEALQTPQGLPFVANQCAQRAFLLYSSSREERENAIAIGQKGEHFAQQLESLVNADAGATKSDLLLQPTLWAPLCQQEFVRVDTTLKLARAAIYMKGYCQENRAEVLRATSSGAPDSGTALPEPPGALEYQLVGRTVVARMLTGRVASVLQCFMGLKMSTLFHPRVFDAHVKAAKNFEEHLSSPGPQGPLEDAAGYTDAEFALWMEAREHAVAKQFQLVSQLVAEICVARNPQMLSTSEARWLLHAAENIFENECQYADTLRRAVKTFQATEDMI